MCRLCVCPNKQRSFAPFMCRLCVCPDKKRSFAPFMCRLCVCPDKKRSFAPFMCRLCVCPDKKRSFAPFMCRLCVCPDKKRSFAPFMCRLCVCPDKKRSFAPFMCRLCVCPDKKRSFAPFMCRLCVCPDKKRSFAPFMCRLCVCPDKKRSFAPFMCLELVLQLISVSHMSLLLFQIIGIIFAVWLCRNRTEYYDWSFPGHDVITTSLLCNESMWHYENQWNWRVQKCVFFATIGLAWVDGRALFISVPLSIDFHRVSGRNTEGSGLSITRAASANQNVTIRSARKARRVACHVCLTS